MVAFFAACDAAKERVTKEGSKSGPAPNPAVTALTHELARLALNDGVLCVRLARFGDMPIRSCVEVSGTVDTIMDALRAAVRDHFHETSDQPVNFCTWLPCTNGRTDLSRGNDILRYFHVTQDVWFWIGTPAESPPSPDKETKALKHRLDALEVETHGLKDEQQRLRLNSTSSAALQLEYSKCTQWTIVELRDWLRVSEEGSGNGVVAPVVGDPPEATEASIQTWWQNVLKTQLGLAGIVDTHTSHAGGFQGQGGELHQPDFCWLVGNSLTWEQLVCVFELKKGILTAEQQCKVVIQVFRRLVELFDHQPHRTLAYGIGLDASHVCFVRAERNLTGPQARRLFASAPLALFNKDRTWSEHGQLLLRFLRLKPAALGFVAVQLPVLLGVQMETVLCRRAEATLYRAGPAVYKVGARADIEHTVLQQLIECNPPVCPRVLSHTAGVVVMEAGTDVRAVVNLDLARLACDLYWAVYQLHQVRIVHCDIKPANVVRMADRQHRLVDFDRALDLDYGQERTVCTEGFDHHDDVIVQECPEDFDLEGVFWTVVYLWTLKQQQRQRGKPSQHVHQWQLLRGQLAIKACRGCPEVRALIAEQCDVYLFCLRHPRDVMQRLLGLRVTGDSVDSWLIKAREEEARLGTLSCPELLLRHMFNALHVE